MMMKRDKLRGEREKGHVAKSWRFAPRRWSNCSAVVRTGRRDRAETARWQDSLGDLQQDVETEQQQLLVQCVAAVGRERSNSCSLECCAVTAACQIAVRAEMLCCKEWNGTAASVV
jgi:hypothetical protein